MSSVSKDDSSATPRFSHLDEQGRAHMVAVSDKPETLRTARASGLVIMNQATLDRIVAGALPKGDVVQVARIAGIAAVKRTADLIPLCHPLRITSVKVEFAPSIPVTGLAANERALAISATVSACDRTGVEMEALTAVTVAGLTIYDMCKAIDRSMRITAIQLEEKTGGRSGHYHRQSATTGTES